MELQKQTTLAPTTQKIQLVKGVFSPSEAFEVINGLIEGKTQYHRLALLKSFESQHENKSDHIKERLAELEAEKNNLREFIQSLPEEGFNVKVNGILEITSAI